MRPVTETKRRKHPGCTKVGPVTVKGNLDACKVSTQWIFDQNMQPGVNRSSGRKTSIVALIINYTHDGLPLF